MKPSDRKSPTDTKPDPEYVEQQLPKPSGSFAPKISSMMNQVNKPLYNLVFDVMKPQKNDHILEIGFGKGKFFGELLSIEPSLQISAVDFSEEMVDEAKKYNQDRIAAGKLEIKSGSSEAIPFADQTFDKVFCNMVIYFWDPRPRRRFVKNTWILLKNIVMEWGTMCPGNLS